jgi:hypothetical protein
MSGPSLSEGLLSSFSGMAVSSPKLYEELTNRLKPQFQRLLEIANKEEKVPGKEYGLFASRKLALDQEIKNVFPKVRREFTEARTTYNIYMRMRGSHGGSKEARLVIIYKDENFCKELKNILRNAKNWRNLLKTYNYKEPLYEVGDPSVATGSNLAISERGENSWSILGAKILVRYRPPTSLYEPSPSPPHLRSAPIALGGTVPFDDKLFGLTVGHHDIFSGSHDMSQEVIPEHDLTLYKVANQENEIIETPSRKGQSSALQGLSGEVHGFQFGTGLQLSMDESPEAADWALIKMEPTLPLANILTFDFPASDEGLPALKGTVLVKDIMTEAKFSTHKDVKKFGGVRCFIVTKEGIWPSLVALGTSILVLSGKSLEVLNIVTGIDLRKLNASLVRLSPPHLLSSSQLN